MSQPLGSLDLTALAERYRSGALDPVRLVEALLARIAARGDDKVWIHLLPREELLAQAAALAQRGPEGLPLYGIPFAIKDNIDLAGHPTTAACPAYAYRAADSAPVVAALIAAGAMPIGKTNLDQFATGLVGTRSPYGACTSPFDPAHISGGSSSGSAVAVAAGLVSFALGTDTAGSGRVPAAFANIIGLKPTRGLLSTRGVVPACRSLDCISLFALSAADAGAVLAVAQGFDPRDPFSRPAPAGPGPTLPHAIGGCRFGIPRAADLEFFGNAAGAQCFADTVACIERLGGQVVEIDFTPFFAAARLLYEGPWLAERYAAVGDFLARRPDAFHPVTRQVIEGGARPSAVAAFAAYYEIKALRRATEPVWQAVDLLLMPTAPRSYTIAEVEAEPFRLNANLGHYTNFVNLLDLGAIAVPAGFQADGLPFGVTLVAPAFQEEALLMLGDGLHRARNETVGARGARLPEAKPVPPSMPAARQARIAVCGAHMTGLPLNHQLVERGGRLLRRCRTAAHYRMYALTGLTPIRPGLLRSEPGAAIEVEIWELPLACFGSFVDAVSAPLGIGTIELEDGERVHGFLCESYATREAEEISQMGSWRCYLERSGRG